MSDISSAHEINSLNPEASGEDVVDLSVFEDGKKQEDREVPPVSVPFEVQVEAARSMGDIGDRRLGLHLLGIDIGDDPEERREWMDAFRAILGSLEETEKMMQMAGDFGAQEREKAIRSGKKLPELEADIARQRRLSEALSRVRAKSN